jgi:hypothetical protein
VHRAVNCHVHATIRTVLGIAVVVAIASCSAVGALSQSPTVSVAPGIAPRMSSTDAVRVTLDYLGAQRDQLLAPEMHRDPVITSVVAVTANDAPAIDGCIPAGKGAGVVWIMRGTGDYLNLADHPWSSWTSSSSEPEMRDHAVPGNCPGPGPAGVIVIDDATGDILGVYPLSGPDFPHPTAAPSG